MLGNTYIYIQARNSGVEFYTNENAKKFILNNIVDDVWACSVNLYEASLWIQEKNLSVKTREEAQVIVDSKILEAQTNWDNETEEYKQKFSRPKEIILK